ncbi:cdc20/fizzy protein cortex [Rhynchophorus ferrugineus]|uniref:Protein cortex n=1 Tax=Rhynchophorus ferrugineus TaxID=354439 RepID=A0A834IBI3_RHYFE|nr:hypothetical protein GWI33_012364 [Rhynchophorus ferrugineus]
MKQATNAHYSLDRFIPRRCINLELNHYNLTHSEKDYLSSTPIENELLNETFINTAKYANMITNYRKLLLRSIYQQTPDRPYQMPVLDVPEKTPSHTWPVKPRRKPLIKRPEIILDMPDISTTIYHHVIDWGKSGLLATIFHSEVYLWPFRDSKPQQTDSGGTILDCIKWNKSGTHFAVSRTLSRLSIFDAERLKITRNFYCKCDDCVITAIEWTSKEYVFSGCSKGAINVVFKNSYRSDHTIGVLTEEIIDLQLSCNERYLTVRGMSGSCVVFKLAQTMEEVFVAKGGCNYIKSTAWHPWKESVLAIADITNTIYLWNINNRKLIDKSVAKPFFREENIIDCLTFNPVSAELLVSFYCESSDPDTSLGYNFLTVFSDMHTIVDELKFHNARVPFALWDGTGTKLATVSVDENLAIWEFFGEAASDIRGKRPQKRRDIFSVFDNERRFNECLR